MKVYFQQIPLRMDYQTSRRDAIRLSLGSVLSEDSTPSVHPSECRFYRVLMACYR